MAAVMVYMQYLTQLEGPMWKQIRGQGLSYHYRMYMKPETGLLYFILAKSSHLVDAYKEAYKIVNDFLNGSTVFSELELTACKSSLIFNIIEEEETPSHASVQSILSYLRGIEHGYNRKIIQMIPKVTVEDLQRIGPKYLAPLFDPARSKVAICCHPSKVEEICRELQSSVTKELTVIESLDDAFLCDL
jgi:Zn-dependent M16 (insulinase) family peptidase